MTILVTGSTDGIGLATARVLLHAGHRVILHGRTEERVNSVVRSPEIERHKDRTATITADFSSLAEVDTMAAAVVDRFPDLQILVNNAGVMTPSRRESADGYELNLAVNHLAPALLTLRLVNLLRSNRNLPGGARIVVVASMVHEYNRINWPDLQFENGYDGQAAYGQSKVANVMFTRVLSERLSRSHDTAGLTVNALHPGVISTKLLHVFYGGGAPPEEGARTSVYLATNPDVAGISGRYFADSREKKSWVLTGNSAESYRLWKASVEMIERVVGPIGSIAS